MKNRLEQVLEIEFQDSPPLTADSILEELANPTDPSTNKILGNIPHILETLKKADEDYDAMQKTIEKLEEVQQEIKKQCNDIFKSQNVSQP